MDNCIASSFGPTKNFYLRFIMFEYSSQTNPVADDLTIEDVLLEPINVGATIGFPYLTCPVNRFNQRGVKILMDKKYHFNGNASGAIADESTGETTNWGLGPVKNFQVNKWWKNGKRVRYQDDSDGKDLAYPVGTNIGMMIIPYSNSGSKDGDVIAELSIYGDMLFKDL